MNTKSRPRTLTDFRRLGKRRCPDPEAAKALHDERFKRDADSIRLDRQFVMVQNSDLAHDAFVSARLKFPRRRNWESAAPAKENGVRENDNGQYSRRYRYTHYTYTPTYRSYAILPACQKIAAIVYYYGERKKLVRAPAGMVFATDSMGLHLRRASDGMELHVDGDDLTRRNFRGWARREMADNYNRRIEAARIQREQERFREIFERESATTRVTLADSLAAGNCVAGSLEFAERKLGLCREDILRAKNVFHVSASRILSSANGDKCLALKAIRAAFARETLVSI